MSVAHLPVPSTLTAPELLANCATRQFQDVLVLGYYQDGELKHAGTLTVAERLHLLETYKLILLGVIDGASRTPEGKAE